MIQKLLLFVRSIFFLKLNSSSGRSFAPNVKLLCLGMFFVFSNNYGQCAYPSSTTTKIGSDQTFCIDGTNLPNISLRAQQYVVVNVISGYNYTFGISNIWAGGGTTNVEYLGLYNDATNAYITQNNGTNGTSVTWTATFSGKIKVLLLRNNNCSTTTDTTAGTFTFTLNSSTNNLDDQTFAGNNVWRGHVYNFTSGVPPGGSSPPNPANTNPFAAAQYAGYYDVGSETIPTNFNFGGNTACFPIYSNGAQLTNIYTEQFAVRSRMKSTRAAGCYLVTIKGDDGVRLYVDNVLVFDEWIQQSAATYSSLLVYLNGNSDLILDYYENDGANELSFSITPFSASSNTVTVPAATTVCSATSPGLLDGSSYPYNGSTVNKTIKFQWQSAPDVSGVPGTWSNIASATAEDYTPGAITTTTTPNVTWYRRNVSAVASNASSCTYNSNEFAITTRAATVGGTVTGGTTICSGTQPGNLTLAGNTGSVTKWQKANDAGFTVGLTDIAVTTNTLTGATIGNLTATTYFRAVVQNAGCPANSGYDTVTVTPVSVGGTVSGSSSVCAGTNSTVLTLAGNTGSVVRWESSTDNFASVITPITNTTATLTATNVLVTTYYRAVVQNGTCPVQASSTGSVTITNPVATGVSICQGGSGSLTSSASCGAVAQTPSTATGSGGTSNATTYGGSGNTNITVNFPALPAGAVVTSTNITISFNSVSPSWKSELLVRATPPAAFGAAQSDLNPAPTSAANDSPGSVSNLPLGTWGTGNPAGNWVFAFRESFDDNGVNPDATISNITITVNYTLPGTIDWYTVASGGTKIGSGSPFNPVGVAGSGLANTNTAGTTSYYAACSGDSGCRTKVDFVINDTTAPTVSTTQPTCTVNTATITITSPSPAPGITYSINGSTYTNTTGVFTGVAVGPYNVTTKNSSGCTSLATPVNINAATVKTWTGTTSTNWNVAGNWSPSGVPTAADCVVIPNVTNKPIITGSGVNGFAQALTVNNSASLTVNSANTLTVTDAVTVVGPLGSLVFENNASLIQVNDSPTINSGNINYKRISPQIRLADFTYWSTPVSPQTLFDVSPLTLFDKYFGYDGDNWVGTNSSTVMTVGKGYIIRGPQNFSRTAKADYPATFIGVPNNGNLVGETLAADKAYLIGNPYPSALDAKKFLDANLFLNGTLYFWTQNTAVVFAPGYQYYSTDYAAYNVTGGTATYAAPSGSTPGNDSRIPSGKIAAGQSFFASTGSSGGTVAFNNSMRFGAVDNTQFYKPGKTSDNAEANRVWLNLTNEGGAFKQLLVGYIDGATNEFENRYDGVSFDANEFVDFYSFNNGNKYVIQGRALPFTDSDVVPLGYRTTIEGDFTISIDQTDGSLTSQNIYIEDKTTGKVHDLTASNYTFTTAIGSFTDRFVLRYTNKTLGVGDVENLDSNLLVSVEDKVIKITSTKEDIKQVTIFDVSGKLLYDKNKVATTELQLQNLPFSNQVLLVKVLLENGSTVTKKVIFK
ncbi:T9SS sorting signal type C domain-containing protein [Flavobacterium aquidurense]|uniref:RemA protein n=1 Tax=Flavobacterium aquidurense TaxID=362413 RepID=A0A0Q0S6C4_9FLAO|nr:T9SS sorting signal type C domain-containing protein [Flavobacterium aquidurense]KQB41098.1 RemA protein [Flavobacterium aquidurense]